MPYRYTCHACRSRSSPSAGRGPAIAARDEHRNVVHAGLEPAAGDRVHPVRPGVLGPALVIVVLLAFTALEAVTGIAPDDIARWLGIL